jgi:hypothetical protein
MKYFMLLWLCINDPFTSLENTCVQEIMPTVYDTLQECAIDAERTYNMMKADKLYLTTFCSKKDLTAI